MQEQKGKWPIPVVTICLFFHPGKHIVDIVKVSLFNNFATIIIFFKYLNISSLQTQNSTKNYTKHQKKKNSTNTASFEFSNNVNYN